MERCVWTIHCQFVPHLTHSVVQIFTEYSYTSAGLPEVARQEWTASRPQTSAPIPPNSTRLASLARHSHQPQSISWPQWQAPGPNQSIQHSFLKTRCAMPRPEPLSHAPSPGKRVAVMGPSLVEAMARAPISAATGVARDAWKPLKRALATPCRNMLGVDGSECYGLGGLGLDRAHWVARKDCVWARDTRQEPVYGVHSGLVADGSGFGREGGPRRKNPMLAHARASHTGCVRRVLRASAPFGLAHSSLLARSWPRAAACLDQK